MQAFSDRELLIQQATLKRLESDPEAHRELYEREFGHVGEYSADNSANLFHEYSNSAESRTRYREAVGKAASRVAYQAFLHRLLRPGREPVILTGGGTGSGKSTSICTALALGCIVYDSTLTSFEGCRALVDATLASGRNAVVLFVWRDPVDSFFATLKRANSPDGAGRVVQLSTHAFTHRKAVETVLSLHAHYEDRSRVAFVFRHNLGRLGNMCAATIDLVRAADYTRIEEGLRLALEAARSKGKVNETQYRRVLGFAV